MNIYYQKGTDDIRPFLQKNDFLLLGIDRNLLAVSSESFKTYAAVYQSKQCIIASTAYVSAGMDLCAALTNEDVAGQNELTVAALGAEALSL